MHLRVPFRAELHLQADALHESRPRHPPCLINTCRLSVVQRTPVRFVGRCNFRGRLTWFKAGWRKLIGGWAWTHGGSRKSCRTRTRQRWR
jgi:hypothetical protein